MVLAVDHSLWARRNIVQQLRNDAGVTAIVGTRVFGERVTSGVRPLVHVGLLNPAPFEASCFTGSEFNFFVNCYADGEDASGLYTLSAAVVDALNDNLFVADGIQMHALDWISTQHLLRRGPGDRATTVESTQHRAVVQFRARTAASI